MDALGLAQVVLRAWCGCSSTFGADYFGCDNGRRVMSALNYVLYEARDHYELCLKYDVGE